jgi:hypothetical protein
MSHLTVSALGLVPELAIPSLLQLETLHRRYTIRYKTKV